jgi:hypothetical protein
VFFGNRTASLAANGEALVAKRRAMRPKLGKSDEKAIGGATAQLSTSVFVEWLFAGLCGGPSPGGGGTMSARGN